MFEKLKRWIPTNITAILGIVQTVIKFIKEVCTLLIDLICPIIPGDADKVMVEKVRGLCNTVDGWIEKIKQWLLK